MTKGELWTLKLRTIKYVYECRTGETYTGLAELLKGKNYYIVTTNQDAQFYRVFPEDRITRLQGDKTHFILTTNGDTHLELSGFDPACVWEIEGTFTHLLQGKQPDNKQGVVNSFLSRYTGKRLRKNLTGSMAFYSHIPCRMQEYGITHDAGLDRQLLMLHRLFDELNDKMELSGRQVIDDLITMESRDSGQLASNNPRTPFSIMCRPDYNENEENIRRATAYAEDALSELPLSLRLFS